MKTPLILLTTLFYFYTFSGSAQNYQLTSPNDKLEVNINTESGLHFEIDKEGQTLIPDTEVSMTLENGQELAVDDEVKRTDKNSVNSTITPVVAVKNKEITDHYNELTLSYEDYKVIFRAYDDAVAYRFKTAFDEDITITAEQVDVSFPKKASAWFSLLEGDDTVSDRWMTSYEKYYTDRAVDSLGQDRTELPFLVDLQDKGKVLVTESNLHDYPGLYYTGGDNNTLNAIFPPRVKEEKENEKGESGWDRTVRPQEVYDYNAKTSGERTFPWRIFAIADKDADLLNNQIVYKLGKPNRLEDTDWIQPGQVAWDWWNHWNITGVDFEAGINNKTYEHYIDFAAENDVPYIIMDDGWYELGDLTQEADDIDVAHLVQYGKEKDVGVILWASWKTLNDQMEEAMDLFEDWGISGLKIDFMDRDDQDMVNFYYRTAQEAADRHFLVDFHGSHKPTGLDRTYPNIINYEGVAGLEQDKWSDDMATPEMAVSIPFLRMVTGPMDYTPGAMLNAQKEDFRAINDEPMSLGTRAQQVAMYVLYDSPLQMLSDSPTHYRKNKETLDFLTAIPTTWDKTIPLAGEMGEYVAMARQKDEEYFAVAMTNGEARDLTLDFSFLPEGEWTIEIFQDGVNADRNGKDHKVTEKTISNKDSLKIHMAPGGGWVGRIYKAK